MNDETGIGSSTRYTMVWLHPHMAENPEFVERFKKEVSLAQSISHRNVCRVYDLHDLDGRYVIAMECIDGETLQTFLQRKKPSLEETLSIIGPVLDGLAEAHALGMASIVFGGLILSLAGTTTLTGWTGPISIAGACLCWGIDNNVTQKISARDPMQIAALKGLLAGAVNAALAVILGNPWPRWAITGAALVLGFLSYGISLVL